VIKRLSLTLWALLAAAAAAQELSEPKISAELTNRSAFLGDPVTFTIRIHHDDAWTFEPIRLGDKLGEAAVLSQKWTDSQRNPDTGLSVAELQAELAWYRFGEYKVPPVKATGQTARGETRTFETAALTVEIIEMLSEDDQDLAPAKGQVSLDAPALWPYLLGGMATTLALIGLAIWLIRRYAGKRPKPAEKAKPLPPPDVEALDRLRELTHGPLLKEGRYKAFYVAINQIIRRYYARLFGIHAEEMTSFELEDWLQTRGDLPDGAFELNRGFQELCDRVKFAKHDPLDAENKDVVNHAYQIVDLLKPKPREEGAHVAAG